MVCLALSSMGMASQQLIGRTPMRMNNGPNVGLIGVAIQAESGSYSNGNIGDAGKFDEGWGGIDGYVI